MKTLQDALTKTFTTANVPDNSIRLGWQAMTGCYEIPMSGDCKDENGIKELDADHRERFNKWVKTLKPQGSTPSHRMLINAGEYYKKTLDINSAWASIPGTKLEPVLGCRKSYDLFMTDGGWNSWTNNAWTWVGNADGTSRDLPDTTFYDSSSPNTKIYRDNFGSTTLPTLSDIAFYYWATDLQPNIANVVPKRVAHEGDQTFSSGGTTRTIPDYWNPRNDPATWQHMNTYTVGFNDAANWNTKASPKMGSDTWTGGDYDALMVGNKTWTNAIAGDEDTRMPELWHMALNSRGKYVPAPDADALASAFQDIMNTIQSDQSTPLTSITGSSTTTAFGSNAFLTGYAGAEWSGYVTAHPVAAGTGVVSVNGTWGNIPGVTPPKPVSTASVMDAASFVPASRTVFSHDGTNPIKWGWSVLSNSQKANLNTLNGVVDTKGPDRLDFLRGDRTKEKTAGGAFRTRSSRQGDIVNSALWYLDGKPANTYAKTSYATFRSDNASRASMLYVGGNDGMLHGFSSADGSEKIAYVPLGLYPTLSRLSDPGYQHSYYVDGSPLSGDIELSTGWKTYLAGFLGGGGRGYFVLDVTKPDGFATASAAAVVVMDNTGVVDVDVGHIMSKPVLAENNVVASQQITQLNNGRWALVMGNGYNSTNEQAVLLVQYLDGAKELLKLKVGTPGGNGLGAPRLVDLNGDRIPDVAYAGDLQGNLWKFDLSSATASSWASAFSGTPLFVAKSPAGATQPITAAPVWLPHPEGGLMVIFGTGQNLTDADRATTGVQTMYGVWDTTSASRDTGGKAKLAGGNAITDGRAKLVAQTPSTTVAGTSDTTGKRLWQLSKNDVSYKGANPKRGWYIDLPISGERVLENLAWFDGQLIDIRSTVPSVGSSTLEESCSPTSSMDQTFLNTLNGITGSAPTSQIYAYTASTVIGEDPKTASRIESSLGYPIRSRKKEISVCPPGQTCDARDLLGMTSGRPSWRQFQ